MCRRDELNETIGIAAQVGCDPTNAARMLKNVTRHITESGPELSEDDKRALLAAKEAAKQAVRSNFDHLLAGI